MKCFITSLVNLSRLSSDDQDPAEDNTVLFDSGANCCITNRKSDFVGDLNQDIPTRVVDGIGKGLKVEGTGTVSWTFAANGGTYRTLLLPCHYVPSSTTRIASLQRILEKHPKETFIMKNNHLILSGHGKAPKLTVQLCSRTNLPVASTEHCQPCVHRRESRRDGRPKKELPTKFQPSLTSPSNMNLTEPEKELLRWHHRLGHIGMKKVQWLFRQGILATSELTRRLHAAAAKLTHSVLCTACQYAKQRRNTTPGTVVREIKHETGALKKNNLFPGQEVSVDHFYCNPLGRLLTSYGKESSDKKYKGGCIFVDHATGVVFVQLQSRLNSHQTLDAKKAFEQHCAEHGVIAQSYLSDNGTQFVSADFEKHLQQFHQTIHHSGVGAHHSNGIAERSIGTVLSIARAMLHHAAIHWPDVADVELWPLAVLHAVHIVNRIPRDDSGRSPIELFSRKTWPSSKFHDFHVWGCPTYVLNSTISSGNKLPRWQPRSARCMYVGNSLKHGHSVPLVLDLETGAITPQYHVVFDDEFKTVQATDSGQVNFDHDDWYQTFGLNPHQYVPDDVDDRELPRRQVTESEGARSLEASRDIRDRNLAPRSTLQRELDPAPVALPPNLPASPAASVVPPTSGSLLPEASAPAVSPSPSLQRETIPEPIDPKPINSNQITPSTSQPNSTELSHSVSPQPVPTKQVTPPLPKVRTRPPAERPRTRSQAQPRRSPRLNAHHVDDHEVVYERLFAGKAKANSDPDTLSWDEAMASPYREDFLKAAQDEIEALVGKSTWYEDLKTNATTKIIPSQWVFRIKRTPDGAIKKFKARIVLRGDLQDDNGQDNFSPVAAWSTVRGFLVTSTVRNWITTTIDFSNAFVQSNLPDDDPVWMHIPRGYISTLGREYCLKLVKSLYGHRRAPQLWFNHSSDGFKKLGLEQSPHDPCLWYGKDIMLVQYVDDCGISAPTQERIDKFVSDLRNLNFELTQEGSFAEFLGIKFETLPNGSIKCTQKGLIKKTLEAAGMENCNPNSVPAAQAALAADVEGPPMEDPWNYRGICGMLLYLSTNTRPDITFAVSQVCRFGQNPKKSHASAVKTILRYLKKTENEGITINPEANRFNLDLYVDADFCGLFGREDPRDPNSVRSRTGYIAMLCGWPIIWKSALQTHLSQSTLEAEYSALSSALRVFLPLKKLILEMIERTKCKSLEGVRLHATVFEDNQSTYFLATNQRITSRTKYLLAKWHWFWDEYNKGEFSIVKCPTDQQRSDYLTKALPKVAFEQNREAVQGW